MTIRRLPVYLLLDCSESMAGPAIEAVGQGVGALVKELRANPQAVETAHLSVITFSREARQTVPLTELMAFQIPTLSVRPGTALGAALALLKDCLKREVVKTTPTAKGDYKPLVFIMTDGQPTDAWEAAARALKEGDGPRLANLVIIGCGPDVDIQVLYAITDSVLLLPDPTEGAISKFFAWVSSSVQAVSVRLDSGGENNPLNLPALPLDALEVATPQHGNAYTSPDGLPRQVFLHAYCSESKRPYLMRYTRREYEERYDAVGSHPLAFVDEGDEELSPPINSSLLIGCPPCPYCQHRHTGMCPCGTLFCSPETLTNIVCPKCDASLGPGPSESSFKIQQTQG